MTSLPASFLLSLALTLAVELPLAFAFGMRRRELLIALLVNCMTNPAAMLLALLLRTGTPLPRWAIELPIEAAVVVIEWLVYRRGTAQKYPLLTSLCLNAVSYGLGLVIGWL